MSSEDADQLPASSASSAGKDAELDLDKLPKCPECGYILYKLARLRCPECGTTIRPEDLFPSEDQLMLARQARRERMLARVGCGLLLAGVTAFIFACLRGPWHLYVCVVGPLTAITVIVLGRCLILGEEMHWPLLACGLIWAFIGAALLFLS